MGLGRLVSCALGESIWMWNTANLVDIIHHSTFILSVDFCTSEENWNYFCHSPFLSWNLIDTRQKANGRARQFFPFQLFSWSAYTLKHRLWLGLFKHVIIGLCVTSFLLNIQKLDLALGDFIGMNFMCLQNTLL